MLLRGSSCAPDASGLLFAASTALSSAPSVVSSSRQLPCRIALTAAELLLPLPSAPAERTVHRDLGFACTALGAAQITAIVLRPQKGSKYRFGWEVRAQATASGSGGYLLLLPPCPSD